MLGLIQSFDWTRVVVAPWTENGSLTFWTVAMGFLVATACGLIGNYLILRRMALVGDAISHSVLPGLALAFLTAGALARAGWGPFAASSTGGHHDLRNPWLMFAGALIAGVLTTVLIELIHKKSRVKQDAAIGIVFSSLFAIGVILISLFADRVDLDQECVLYGEITFVGLEPPFEIAGLALGPPPVLRMAVIAALTLLLVLIFYKELLVSSFDSGLASSLGINATFVHYALMCWLSVVVVSAFESVGAILVIAMLIMPGATASLLSQRLPVILALSVLLAAVSSVLGFHLAVWLDCSAAGAMVVAACGCFVVAWLVRQGLSRTRRSATQPAPEMTDAKLPLS